MVRTAPSYSTTDMMCYKVTLCTVTEMKILPISSELCRAYENHVVINSRAPLVPSAPRAQSSFRRARHTSVGDLPALSKNTVGQSCDNAKATIAPLEQNLSHRTTATAYGSRQNSTRDTRGNISAEIHSCTERWRRTWHKALERYSASSCTRYRNLQHHKL